MQETNGNSRGRVVHFAGKRSRKSRGRKPKAPDALEFPHDLAAEEGIIGGIIIDNSGFRRLPPQFRSDFFYRQAHKTIFDAMTTLAARGEAIDWLTLRNALGDDLDAVGGPVYIAKVTDGVPRSSNIEYYAGIVMEKAAARFEIETCIDAVARLQENPTLARNGLPEEVASTFARIKAETTSSAASDLFVDDLALMTRPEPTMLIAGRLPANASALFVGPPGIGKSIVSTDLALCIPTACDWLGAAVVTPGPVVYVVGEGGLSRFKVRLLTAKLASGFSVDEKIGIYAFDGALNLLDVAAVAKFAGAAATLNPVLVIIDTLNRCTVGGDENSAKDMGLAIASMDSIRTETGATVLAIHHSPKDSARTDPRGSGALSGAVDSIVSLTASSDGGLRLTCAKQRDAAPFEPVSLRLRPYGASVVPDLYDITADRSTPVANQDDRVLAVLTGSPQSLNKIVERLRAGKGTTGPRLRRLAAQGLAAKVPGGWIRGAITPGPPVLPGLDRSDRASGSGPVSPVSPFRETETGPGDRTGGPDRTESETVV